MPDRITDCTDSDVPRAYDFHARNVTDDDDGYALYRQHAEDTGRADQWVEWSADEFALKQSL